MVEIKNTKKDTICGKFEKDNLWIFRIQFSTKNSTNRQFSLVYTLKDIPINLNQKSEMFISNNDNIYFLCDPNPFFLVQFNLKSDYTDFFIHRKPPILFINKKNSLNFFLSELNYDFKKYIGNEEKLHIIQKMICKTRADAVIMYLVLSKFD